MKLITIIILFSISTFLVSEETCGNYFSEEGKKGSCEQVVIDASDKSSLQRGLKLYMNYCFGCHSLKYGRYNRISKDLSIPQDLFEKNLIFVFLNFLPSEFDDIKMGSRFSNVFKFGTTKYHASWIFL